MWKMARVKLCSSSALLEHVARFQIVDTCRTFGRPELHPSALLARNILHELPVRQVNVVQNDFHILLHESPLGHIQRLLDRGTSSRVGRIPSCKARHSRW